MNGIEPGQRYDRKRGQGRISSATVAHEIMGNAVVQIVFVLLGEHIGKETHRVSQSLVKAA